jgi:hypothetical protein
MKTVLFQMPLESVNNAMRTYARAQRARKGDAFATLQELESILHDPWAWEALFVDLFRTLFGAYTYCRPDYRLGIVVVESTSR